jgi:hypothetical protein
LIGSVSRDSFEENSRISMGLGWFIFLCSIGFFFYSIFWLVRFSNQWKKNLKNVEINNFRFSLKNLTTFNEGVGLITTFHRLHHKTNINSYSTVDFRTIQNEYTGISRTQQQTFINNCNECIDLYDIVIEQFNVLKD